jgi:hypothetical protein
MQHATDTASARSLRIRDEAEDRPSTRRSVVGACLLAAVAVHGALAFVPLNFGGSPAEYGVDPGSRYEVTLMAVQDEMALAAEQSSAAETLPPPVLDIAADLEPATSRRKSSHRRLRSWQRQSRFSSNAPQPRPLQWPRKCRPGAGAGERTLAKPNYLRNPPPKYPPSRGSCVKKVSCCSR